MVGILFTTIIPLFIYVNEVNNYYDRTVVNMKIADQERSMEDLDVYAFGHSQTSEKIDVFLVNRGSVSLNVTRIWVMRKDLQKTLIFTSVNLSCLPLQLDASAQITIENLSLTTILESENLNYFNIEVATERGNKYPSITNPLHKTAFGWETGVQDFQIQVIVLSDWGLNEYKVETIGADNSTSGFYDIVKSYQVHGDFFTIIPVPRAGSYNVTVWKWKGGGYNAKVGNSTVVLLTWSHPSTLRKFDDT